MLKFTNVGHHVVTTKMIVVGGPVAVIHQSHDHVGLNTKSPHSCVVVLPYYTYLIDLLAFNVSNGGIPY